jgi:hypothetical protein
MSPPNWSAAIGPDFIQEGVMKFGLLIVGFIILLSVTNGQPLAADTRIRPEDFEYLGAFRLPVGAERPRTFEYGGSAMTFNPDGDPSGAADGFSGSLFVMGHDRLAYGELPDGGQIAEITIPAPLVTDQIESLPQAAFLQDFSNVTAGFFTDLDEIPRAGMLYLNTPATGPKIHMAWGQHLQDSPEFQRASHAWFDPNLAEPNMQGTWFIGDQSLHSVNGYLLEIPAAWANQYTEGRVVGTGRFRDGGWSGMGPSLFAYRPWIDETGTPASDQTHLPETTLLLYEKSTETDEITHSLEGYQHPDEWEGGAWIETDTGKTALLFAGTKSTGAKYWYGYINPAGPDYPCVEGELAGEFPICRLADGTLCPADDLIECDDHTSLRGWWSSSFEARFILYDPADLARVALGQIESWEPQPYAYLNIDENLFFNPAGIELDMVGTGVQRRFRIGEVAYDRAHNLLYVLELFADGASPVVHVWKVN